MYISSTSFSFVLSIPFSKRKINRFHALCWKVCLNPDRCWNKAQAPRTTQALHWLWWETSRPLSLHIPQKPCLKVGEHSLRYRHCKYSLKWPSYFEKFHDVFHSNHMYKQNSFSTLALLTLGWGQLVCCRMLSSIPGLYSPDASNTFLPSHDKLKRP